MNNLYSSEIIKKLASSPKKVSRACNEHFKLTAEPNKQLRRHRDRVTNPQLANCVVVKTAGLIAAQNYNLREPQNYFVVVAFWNSRYANRSEPEWYCGLELDYEHFKTTFCYDL
jgi:hypothetical protein